MSNGGGVAAFAPAKINLFLHVGKRRADGYHDLQSLVVFTDTGDRLFFAHAAGLSLKVEGLFSQTVPNGADNLVLKAAYALAEYAKQPAQAAIALTKNLPVSSGLGGGSADAAAALRGLCELWGLNLPAARLRMLGESLGSDVPVCIACAAAWMEGRGERVTAVRVPPLHLVLVNPGDAVTTRDVFARLERRSGIEMDLPPDLAGMPALLEFLRETENDLEAPATALAPAIKEVVAALSASGALLARMSGSGATCFGLYESAAHAEMAAKAVAETRPDWWVRAAKSTSISKSSISE